MLYLAQRTHFRFHDYGNSYEVVLILGNFINKITTATNLHLNTFREYRKPAVLLMVVYAVDIAVVAAVL